MKQCRLFWVVALVGVLACQAPGMTTQQRIQAQDEVTTQFNAWVTAMNNGNRDEVLAFYHDNDQLLVAWPDGTVANGYDEQRLALHNFFNATRYMNFVVSTTRTELMGPRIALSTFGHSTDIIGQDSNRRVMPGKGTVVWVRVAEDDTWKIHVQQLSANSMN